MEIHLILSISIKIFRVHSLCDMIKFYLQIQNGFILFKKQSFMIRSTLKLR